MKKFKKAAAGFLAVVSMVTCVAGMSASAYSPTISKTVNGVTGTLYSDASHATGTTACPNKECWVKVKHGGATSGWVYAMGKVTLINKNTNGTANATTWHKITGTSAFSIVY